MQRALQDATAGDRQVAITAAGAVWQLYVYGVTRVGHELFIQTALFGPRTCTAVVRVGARRTRAEASREVVRLITDWLTSGDERDHAFLEAADPALVAC